MIGFSLTSKSQTPGHRNILFDGVDIINKALSNITGNDYKKVKKFFRFHEVNKDDPSDTKGIQITVKKKHFVLLTEKARKEFIGTVCANISPYDIANPFCL
jgi:hypothetical protein